MRQHNNKPNQLSKALWIAAFSVAFALVESAVVIYLRAMYYPDGFPFPLQTMPLEHASVELFRELATLIMIGSVAVLCGHNRTTRFAWFLIIFAIWDIFYYVFLKLFLHWPAAWLDFDILFLLPTVWTGPVLAPIAFSLLMILLGYLLLHFNRKWHAPLSRIQWILLIAASLTAIASFALDFIRYQVQISGGDLLIPSLSEAENWLINYTPDSYPWSLFALSTVLIALAMLNYLRNQRIPASKLPESQWF